MIVPRTRLLLWVGVVVLPFSILGALEPAATLLAILVVAALFALAGLDAILSLGVGEKIKVELPEVLRLSKDRPGTLDVLLRNPTSQSLRLSLGLPFPAELRVPSEQRQILLPAGTELSRVSWDCLPLQRGYYTLRQAFLEIPSKLGFWGMRHVAPIQSEIRVYPNLLSERKSLAALFLNRGQLGVHAQRQVGKGRDFEKLREYIHGDSFEDIHWKATAKRGHPVTKVFQIERTQELYVVIDASRLTARAVLQATSAVPKSGGPVPDHHPGQASILERFITAALVLGLAAEQQGDLFGLLTFSDKIERFVRAKNGQAHYNTCRDAIYALQPRLVTPDFNELASFIRLRLRRRALLVVLTALDDPLTAESFVQHLDLVSRQHLVLVNMMKPAGADPLFSDSAVHQLDDLYQRLGGHLQWHKLRELEKVLQRRGVRFSLLENERLSVQLVSQYLAVKQRQLL